MTLKGMRRAIHAPDGAICGGESNKAGEVLRLEQPLDGFENDEEAYGRAGSDAQCGMQLISVDCACFHGRTSIVKQGNRAGKHNMPCGKIQRFKGAVTKILKNVMATHETLPGKLSRCASDDEFTMSRMMPGLGDCYFLKGLLTFSFSATAIRSGRFLLAVFCRTVFAREKLSCWAFTVGMSPDGVMCPRSKPDLA